MAAKLPELKIPLIPPKTLEFKGKFDFNEEEENASWYYVQSPREKNGAVGPFPLADLRNLYKIGDIGDTTLMWQEGLEQWDQLKDLPTLRHKLVYLPLIPPRLGSTFEDATVNPIMNPPAAHIAAKFEDINQYRVAHSCSRCGNFASNHVQDDENILPAFGFIRSEIGSSKEFSEIIPGFLFIGNSSSSRPK